MINYIQSNYNDTSLNTYIIDESFWIELVEKIKNKNKDTINYVKNKSIYYNIQIKNLLMKFIMYLINNKLININNNNKFIDFIYYIVHNTSAKDIYLLNYTIFHLEDIIISL